MPHRTLAAALTLGFAISLTACGSKSAETADPAANSSEMPVDEATAMSDPMTPMASETAGAMASDEAMATGSGAATMRGPGTGAPSGEPSAMSSTRP